MAKRKILTDGDPALRKICKPVDKFNLRLHLLLRDMADTMYDADGVGLAAPQVGILRRAVVIDVGDGLVELVNPVILSASEETQTGREGCLSVPGRAGIVTRPMRVKVRAQDRNGAWFELEAEELFARAVCHELAHLDGQLYTDIMDRELTREELEAEAREQEAAAAEEKA